MLITHSANGHMDDFLSLALASYATKDTCIKRVKHADVDEAIAAMTSSDIMMDIGGVLDPKKRIFDHHQDKVLNASFVHIANFFGLKLPKDSLWQYFSDVDTKGPKQARELHALGCLTVKYIHSVIQPILRTWDLVLSQGTAVTDMFITIGDYLSKRGFDLDVLQLFTINDIVQKTYPKHFAEAKKQLAEEEEQREKAIDLLTQEKIGNYSVAIHNSSVYLSHENTDTPVILTLNQRTGKPSLIVDTEVLHVSEILKLLGNPPTVFVHANGFLAVIDDTWENTVNRLLTKKR